tara:strand:+ start:1888 stop:4491 length:2604 start_codon:yes stop_codon:yes gene_type:complete
LQIKTKETPLMRQYNQIKIKYPDALLLFRVGDFYETFGQDAIITSKILGIILTKKGVGSLREIELAGFPFHSLNTYLPKLVKAGHRVAICDQLEDPKLSKTLVKRGVTELITPGVALIDEVLDQKKNNYLASIHKEKDLWGISFLDISTGDFFLDQGSKNEISQLLQKYNPSEVLVSKSLKSTFKELFGSNLNFYFIEDWVFQIEFCKQQLTNHFKTKNLKGFGIEILSIGVIASGVILYYLSETQHDKLNHIDSIIKLDNDDFVGIDQFTSNNLELFVSNNQEGKSLIDSIDYTSTPMGGRLLRKWITFPIKKVKEIEYRHEIIKSFMQKNSLAEKCLKNLCEIGDVERMTSKISTLKINPRELIQLKESLKNISSIKALLKENKSSHLNSFSKNFVSNKPIIDLIDKTLKEDSPANILKGGFIKDDVSKELKDLRSIIKSGKKHLDKMLENDISRTGITSLKIGFNNIFGYYIEVRNTHKDKVPNNWTRKQTLVSAERYITEELKEYEIKILGAEDKIKNLENKFYSQLLNNLQEYLNLLKSNAFYIAKIDCLIGFMLISEKQKYCCPKFNSLRRIEIKQGRHPVIEKHLPIDEPYIPNDIFLDDKSQQIIMITGPNMSGKSALLRQTALIVLLAQIGCYVPAKSANLCIVDNIFTRVGASDNITMGESTFMVEMNESAAILHNITKNSLVLLDEIGRGTSTYDGISIAWAIAQFLHEHKSRPKTLFATHYHELNEMASIYKRIKNYNVSIKELKDSVVFLRKLEPGGTAHSFGIHVAKMAGMPESVLNTAKNKLKFLEKSHNQEKISEALKVDNDNIQLSFINLDDPLLEEIKNEIKELDINSLSPVEALVKLNNIKERILPKK